eukprot:GHVR01138608.1.p1 GENE.GHVR01138608.1~~GHVR01138608.1.p1  ORF type:complete len:212 (-),score=47.89 GHVR01138608.1:127-762(-)
MGRGAFIVFEGLDQSGKTTQSTKLVERLKKDGHTVRHINFPDRTTRIGEIIDGYLKDKVKLPQQCVHLLFSANRWEFHKKISSWLLEGETVVCDRYAFSGVAYSSALGLDNDFCYNSDKGIISPDVVFFLRLDPSIAVNRGGYGVEVLERHSVQVCVANAYNNFKNLSEWREVDGSLSPEVIEEEIFHEAVQIVSSLASKEGNDFSYLWNL